MLTSIRCLREQKRVIVGQYTRSSDLKGLIQVLTTFGPLALLWWAAALSVGAYSWLVVPVVLLISLFTLRVFALMHECGHGSLFRTHRLNRIFGFVFGVTAGMPQYVWSQHHNYHHAHNGNWEKYRGPYATLSVDEYAALTAGQQRFYRHKCSVAAAPLAGCIYLILNPRFTWISGTLGLWAHILRGKLRGTGLSVRELSASYQTRHWKTPKEYQHMLWNNLVLLSVWAIMCWYFGAALFFTIYVLTVS